MESGRTLTLASLLLLAFVGCAETEVVNTHCPIMGGKVDGQTTVEWNGRTVAFCCPPCLDEWAEMTDAEREAALQNAASGEVSSEHGDAHGEHEHADASHSDDHAEQGDGHSEHVETEEPPQAGPDQATAAESTEEESAAPPAAKE